MVHHEVKVGAPPTPALMNHAIIEMYQESEGFVTTFAAKLPAAELPDCRGGVTRRQLVAKTKGKELVK